MKSLKICLLTFLTITVCAGAGTIENSSREKRERLSKAAKCYGKIQVVNAFADYKVKIVTAFPDLRVEVTPFPDGVGKWQFVNAFPDYKIELVEAFEDFAVEFSPFPGLCE